MVGKQKSSLKRYVGHQGLVAASANGGTPAGSCQAWVGPPRLGSKASKVRLAGLTVIAVVERGHSTTHRTQQTEVSSVRIWVVALGAVSEGRRGALTRIDG